MFVFRMSYITAMHIYIHCRKVNHNHSYIRPHFILYAHELEDRGEQDRDGHRGEDVDHGEGGRHRGRQVRLTLHLKHHHAVLRRRHAPASIRCTGEKQAHQGGTVLKLPQAFAIRRKKSDAHIMRGTGVSKMFCCASIWCLRPTATTMSDACYG